MKETKIIKRGLQWGGLTLLCVGLMGADCLEERGIEIVAGANVESCFEARGSDNTFSETRTIDLVADADIRKILDDNGFDGKVVGQLESAFFIITKPETGRVISGSVTVNGQPFIGSQDFNNIAIDEPEYSDWSGVELQEPGVNEINAILEEYFTAVYNGTNPPPTTVTIEIDGVSTPVDVATDFDWCVRLKLTLVGKKEIEVIDPL
jgi:hypothetical protein